MIALYAGLGLKLASNKSGLLEARHESCRKRTGKPIALHCSKGEARERTGSRTPQTVMETHLGSPKHALTTWV